MNSPYVSGSPEAASSSQSSQPAVSLVPTPQSNRSSLGISTASAVSIAFFLSLLTVLTALAAISWIRKRWITSEVSDERPSEKEAAYDVESLAATRPIVPVTPPPDVGWAPQIRSISGPALNQDEDRKPTIPLPKRPRSPPPSNASKARQTFPDSHPKSAPAHAPLFLPHDASRMALKSQREGLSPPVTPLAVAASGMETRSLGRLGWT